MKRATVAKGKPSSGHDSAAPADDELVDLLGRSHAAFQALAHGRAGATCEWKRYSKKAPWALKVSQGERTLFYVIPRANQFEVTVVLGQRAADAALAGRVRPELHAAIRSAKPYVEGRPVKVIVTSREDLVGVEELVAVKLMSAGARPNLRGCLDAVPNTGLTMAVGLDPREIASHFDARAKGYAGNEWHRLCAERLVSLCELPVGSLVLDAGTGTGFAAVAAARRVGHAGQVLAVDVSSGMLREARAACSAAALTNLEFLQADATSLPQCAPGSIDAVTCVAALLYMPVSQAFTEWHRVLKAEGILGFSSMEAGSPVAGQIFRECAARHGVCLQDPSVPLGSAAACRAVLVEHGFDPVLVVGETIAFTSGDLALAWESNFRSPAHAAVHLLPHSAVEVLRTDFLEALARVVAEQPTDGASAKVLYAVGRRR